MKALKKNKKEIKSNAQEAMQVIEFTKKMTNEEEEVEPQLPDEEELTLDDVVQEGNPKELYSGWEQIGIGVRKERIKE